MRAVGLGLLVGSLGLGFGLNTVEFTQCVEYNCLFVSENTTYRWIDGVEVWVSSDFPDQYVPLVERTVKMYNSLANVNLIFRGRSSLSSDYFVDTTTCEFTTQANMPGGITVIVVPEECSTKLYDGFNAGLTSRYFINNQDGSTTGGAVIVLYDYPLSVGNLLVYLHEFGHVLGFSHLEDVGMDPSIKSVMSWSISPTYKDAEILQILYGAPSTGSPMEAFEWSSRDTTFVADSENGLCVAGGVAPFTAFVVSGNCEVKPLKDSSVQCWEVYGEGECTVRVVDSQNSSLDFSLVPLTAITLNDGFTISDSSDSASGGGGGGCNTGAEAGLGTLVALVLYALRRLFSRPLS